MIRLSLLAALLLGACATADAPRSVDAAAAGAGSDAALRRACEAEAERAVNFRNRGQEARLDRDIGQTDQTNMIPSLRVQSDAFNAQVLRQEMIRDCIRANAGRQQPRAATPPAAATPRRGGS